MTARGALCLRARSRAVFGNPWLFPHGRLTKSSMGREERLRVMVEHTKLFEDLLPHKRFALMKKHYKAYLPARNAQAGVTGFPGAVELRAKLMEAPDAASVEAAVEKFLSIT